MALSRRAAGLVLGERSVVAVEVARSGGTYRVVRAAEAAFPEDVSWDDPVGLGRCLARVLHERHMPASGAVGLPARWLATARHEVPPVSRQSLVGLLRLAGDRAFSLGPNRVVFDYASAPPEGQAGTVLLVGALRDRMASLVQALEAARFKPRAVTSTAAALAAAGPPPDGSLTALATPEAVDVARVDATGLRGLRHLPASTVGMGGIATARALRLAASSMGGESGAGARFTLWNGDAADDAFQSACVENDVEIVQPPSLPVEGVSEAAATAGLGEGPVAAGAALAMDALEPRLLPFDLLHSRLASVRAHPWRRPAIWAVIVLFAILLAGALVMADRSARKRDIASLSTQLAEMQPDIDAAQSVVESVTAARAWYDRRPPFLDCLVSLTRAFPEDGRVWATSLAINEDVEDAEGMQCVVTGKATDEAPVLVVLDALRGSEDFAEVKLLYLQETRGAAAERTFSIKFSYVGVD